MKMPPFWSILLVDRFNAFILFYVLFNIYFIDTSFIQMYVNCSIFYILYILCNVLICDFMHTYFVRNDEIKMFNQSAGLMFADEYIPGTLSIFVTAHRFCPA